ncbi:MAG: AhpC/TSA family protein [Bacteroidetes bacterium]|nr:MAG: AhpC/TSA family protein [Bacteroidota bacterium]
MHKHGMIQSSSNPPGWLRPFLKGAAAYHFLWALFFLFWPGQLFVWAGMPLPRYPFLMQGVGMALLLFSLGYVLAAGAPERHIGIGLLAFGLKVAGAIGTLAYVLTGSLPWGSLGLVVINDILWLPPLGLWLAWAYRRYVAQQQLLRQEVMRLPQALLEAYTDAEGHSLADLQASQPALVVFLRHFGCTFCREALADLAQERAAIEARGVRLVLVHMSPPAVAGRFLMRYGLADVAHISDPERRLYEAFDLKRATWGQVFGWRSWLRGAYAGLWRGHLIGRRLGGDGFQMPGAFVVQGGFVRWAYRHGSAADRPDYREMAACERMPAP